MNRSQRVRGGILSDDEIMRQCPTAFSQAGARTYGLLKIDGAPNELAQRPQRADQMINRISKKSGVPVSKIESQYVKSIKNIAINPIIVVSAPVGIPALPVAPTGMPTRSRPYSRAATPLEAGYLDRRADDDLSDIDDARAAVPLPRDGPKLLDYRAAPPIASPFLSISTLGDNVAKMPNITQLGLVPARADADARYRRARAMEAIFASTQSPAEIERQDIIQAAARQQAVNAGMAKAEIAQLRKLRKAAAKQPGQLQIDLGEFGTARPPAMGAVVGNVLSEGAASTLIAEEEAEATQITSGFGPHMGTSFYQERRRARRQDEQDRRDSTGAYGGEVYSKAEGKQPVPFGHSGNFTIKEKLKGITDRANREMLDRAAVRRGDAVGVNVEAYSQGGRVQSSTRDVASSSIIDSSLLEID